MWKKDSKLLQNVLFNVIELWCFSLTLIVFEKNLLIFLSNLSCAHTYRNYIHMCICVWIKNIVPIVFPRARTKVIYSALKMWLSREIWLISLLIKSERLEYTLPDSFCSLYFWYSRLFRDKLLYVHRQIVCYAKTLCFIYQLNKRVFAIYI